MKLCDPFASSKLQSVSSAPPHIIFGFPVSDAKSTLVCACVETQRPRFSLQIYHFLSLFFFHHRSTLSFWHNSDLPVVLSTCHLGICVCVFLTGFHLYILFIMICTFSIYQFEGSQGFWDSLILLTIWVHTHKNHKKALAWCVFHVIEKNSSCKTTNHLVTHTLFVHGISKPCHIIFNSVLEPVDPKT